jgi:hypothetical protein
LALRLCKVCGDWHDLNRPWPHNCMPEAPQRSELACPAVIGDAMPEGQHPYDGRTYDSKSGWRHANKQGGYIEVGNDPARLRPKQKAKPDRKAITATLKKAQQQVFGV